MTAIRLSAVIITFNEETNISRCINSLIGVADDILVVDSFSTDKTRALAEQLGARFIQNKFDGHIQQKNFAIQSASSDYVLSLDADEELSAELRTSILQVKQSWASDAYAFNRLNFYCGKFIRHGNWYPDRKTRLWDRRKGKWGGENPHDTVIMDSGISPKWLKGDLLHYTYRSISQHVAQMNKFSEIAANEAFRKGKKTSVLAHLVINPFFLFFKNYFLRLGFLDGYEGFVVAYHASYYRFLKYAKLRELHRSKN
jgi:glycosyltransferase involved in cell wall biosynthesis